MGGEDVSARIEISKIFSAKGYDVEIMGSENEQKFIDNGVAYTHYSLNRELNLINDVKTVFELRKIFKKQPKNTVIHAFDTKPILYLPLAAMGLKNISVVRSINGVGRIFTDKSFKNTVLKMVYSLIQKCVAPLVDHTIFQNGDDHAYFMEKGLTTDAKSSIVKSSGLNLKVFSTEVDAPKLEKLKQEIGLKEDQKTFILVSRLVRQKGVMNFLEAAQKCHDNGYKYNFLLVGQLDTKKDAITQQEIDGFEGVVNYLGRREDVRELLALSDVFVLPTYYREGVPRVLLEASAMGLALIATNMPGCKDVVTDGENGRLVNIKDSDDLYKKMVDVVKDEDVLANYSKNAQEHVKHFDLDIIVNKYDDCYSEIVSNNQ